MSDDMQQGATAVTFIGDPPNAQPLYVTNDLDSVWSQWCERAATFNHACMPVPMRLTTRAGHPILVNPASIATVWSESDRA